jgi:tripartite-type tricarboxylate transporter receptor subunit TctC
VYRAIRTIISGPMVLILASAAGSTLAQDRAAAPNYPTKPIRIVIGTPAGAGSELIARLAGQQLTDAWGQPAIVEPHPGAGGNIAAEYVARAPADGYTLYVCYGTHTVNPSLYPKLPYDAIKDFAPVTLLSTQVNALTLHPSVPAKTVSELVALAHQRPGRLNYASSGNGAPNHLGMEQFKMMAKLDIVHIPYKGAAPARIDILGGQVDMWFDVLRAVLPYRESGRLRVLAVGSPRRSSLAPDIPTMAESGWNGVEVITWHALLAPAGTPAAIVNRLQSVIARGLQVPALKDKLAANGVEIAAGPPAELDAFLRADLARWEKVVRAAQIRPD